MNHNPEDRFDLLYRIFSSKRFLAMEGLGKEVPYFIETYDIQQQAEVYRKLGALIQRLETSGIQITSFGLYDFVLEYFRASGDLEDLFALETTVEKTRLHAELARMLSLEKEIVPAIASRAREKNADIVMLWQIGEVYPYVRAHELLSILQHALSDRPVVMFFPGTYTSSIAHGFQLSLFGTQTARYYRAFKLDDYIERGNL